MRLLKYIISSILILLIIFVIVAQKGCSADHITYKGKVIDADTLKPIEGAVVVAVWYKTRSMLIESQTVFKYSKEILTDKNGEWSITGPEDYYNKKSLVYLSYIGIYATTSPEITIYKPGYRNSRDYGTFNALPYVLKQFNVEGIVLIRPGNTLEEARKYYEKYQGAWPYIPVKDPEKKLRDLDFSFKYPEDVKTVGGRNEMDGFQVYTVVGLKKAETRKERLDAFSYSAPGDLPIRHKMAWEERERYFGPEGRKSR